MREDIRGDSLCDGSKDGNEMLPSQAIISLVVHVTVMWTHQATAKIRHRRVNWPFQYNRFLKGSIVHTVCPFILQWVDSGPSLVLVTEVNSVVVPQGGKWRNAALLTKLKSVKRVIFVLSPGSLWPWIQRHFHSYPQPAGSWSMSGPGPPLGETWGGLIPSRGWSRLLSMAL